MKTFKEYLTESKKSWKFKIKTVHELTDEQCDRIEKHLTKYDSTGLGAVKKTILQSAPRDFPNHKGYEVAVGSGWNQEQRIKYNANPTLIIGKEITVQYFEETKNQKGELSLRFPTVKHVFENGRNV